MLAQHPKSWFEIFVAVFFFQTKLYNIFSDDFRFSALHPTLDDTTMTTKMEQKEEEEEGGKTQQRILKECARQAT